jgi:hypothetical protein
MVDALKFKKQLTQFNNGQKEIDDSEGPSSNFQQKLEDYDDNSNLSELRGRQL